MELNNFNSEAQELIQKLQDLVDNLVQKGNTSEDCQKICVMNKISSLERAFNGVTQNDFEE